MAAVIIWHPYRRDFIIMLRHLLHNRINFLTIFGRLIPLGQRGPQPLNVRRCAIDFCIQFAQFVCNRQKSPSVNSHRNVVCVSNLRWMCSAASAHRIHDRNPSFPSDTRPPHLPPNNSGAFRPRIGRDAHRWASTIKRTNNSNKLRISWMNEHWKIAHQIPLNVLATVVQMLL